MHASMQQGNYNDPAHQHKISITSDEKIDTIPTTGKKMRNYHVSFSESESISQPEPDQVSFYLYLQPSILYIFPP